jgi:hypothetical protein
LPETDEILNPHKYQCIRCKAPADVIFKKMLPYCFQHEPAESKAARQPEEVEMDKSAKVISATTDVPVPATPTPATPPTVSIGGGWVVNAKDGTELHNGFASKKEASKWASLEVEHKRMKAGQYKIIKK